MKRVMKEITSLGVVMILVILMSVNVVEAMTGSGTEQDPYIIYDVNDLQAMNNDLDAWYELDNDIDASTTVSWNGGAGFLPVGDITNKFAGHFDGKRHTINSLYINRPINHVGLFGLNKTGSEIKNVGLINADVSGNAVVGGLVAYTHGTITNCYSTGSINGDYNIGGLVGFFDGDTITNCYSTASVNGGGRSLGGLIGWNESGTITNCYSTASVNGDGRNVGGLVGVNYDTITNCYSKGSVNSDEYYVGGLVGANYDTITDSYSTASVSGYSRVGGLVGWNYLDGVITNSYSIGNVIGTGTSIGGLVGLSSGSCNDCFWNIETSGQTTSDGGTGKTTAEMKQEATFTNWDFISIWDILENITYPFLKENNQRLVVDAGPDQSVSSGEVVWFDASNSYSPDGTIVSYEWGFRDSNETEIHTNPYVSHRFRGAMNESRKYKVRLTVEDDKGATASDTVEITVESLEKSIEIIPVPQLIPTESFARMIAYYNWVAVTEDTLEDVYVISKIFFEAQGFISYLLSVWDNYSLSIGVPVWSESVTPFWQSAEKTFVYPFGTYRDWTHTFEDGYFEGMAVGPSDKMRLWAFNVAQISGVVGPIWDGVSASFEPSSKGEPIIHETPPKFPDLIFAHLCSPGELRVYDTQENITGLVNGEVREEIPNSVYNKENRTILIFDPNDFYVYEVLGTDEGVYGLATCSVEEDGESTSFTAIDIPTSPNTVHQYTMDWEALSVGEAGAVIKIDADGDGVFERTIISDNKLTACKVAIELIGYELVSQEQISDTEFEYTFRVLAKNSANQDIKNISFKLVGVPSITSLIDDIVYFSIIAPGEDILSDDTAKVRSDKSFEVLAGELVWQICNCTQRPKSDFNRDWYVDLLDLTEFTGQWLQSCSDPNWCQGTDLNHSTAVDFTDFAIFAKDWPWKIIPADFDVDKDVDFFDYAVLANRWMDENCAELAWCYGIDLNKSGQVDFHDLGIFAEHWLEGFAP